jgi:hypothetical protein
MLSNAKSSDKSFVPAHHQLSELNRDALALLWKKFYGCMPPFKISRQLLLQAVAYKMQEQRTQGLKPAARRYLKQVVIAAQKGDKVTATSVERAGTRLLREWHGVTYEATIVKDGVLFKGKQYKSLSEVARLITGTAWSGPLFFGLKKPAKGKSS